MFSETLKRLRLEKGMTQKELAQAIGVNMRTIQYYEKGEHIPGSAQVLRSIANTFDVPVNSLVNSNEFYQMLRSEEQQNAATSDRTELYRILQELTALFAGGGISASDRELFLEAVTSLVLEADE